MVRALSRILLTVVTFTALLIFILSSYWKNSWLVSQPDGLRPIPKDFFKLISPSTYRYVLNESSKCRGRRPFLVLMVPVPPGNRASRDAIRKTWGNEEQIPNVEILRIFFVGLPTGVDGNRIQKDLERESHEHADIVQMDFLDSYHNLTIKTMMMMHWLASSCRGASYAMKIDADIFFNVHCLVSKLLSPNSNSAKHDYITGSVINDGRPRRDKRSKWYISEDLYPETSFPPYVSGAGYVFSADLAGKISWASKFVRPIPLEDIYVGLCLRILGVQPVYAFSLTSMHNLFEINHIPYDRCTYFRRVLVNNFKPAELLHIWHDFQKAKFTC